MKLRFPLIPNWMKLTGRCPDETRLAGYAEGRLSTRERKAIERHLAGCATCLDQVTFLVQSLAFTPPDAVPGPLLTRAKALASSQAARSRTLGVPRWAAVAASACLVFAGTLWIQERSRPVVEPRFEPVSPAPAVPPPSEVPARAGTPRSGAPAGSAPAAPPVRGGRNANATQTELLVQPEIRVTAAQVELRWKAVPGALFYDVTVFTDEGNVHRQARTAGTSAEFPLAGSFAPGQKYFVRLRANFPDGKTVQSRAVSFEVAR